MHQDKDIDKRVDGLLSGLGKILSAIAEMRNKGSDSHSVGSQAHKHCRASCPIVCKFSYDDVRLRLGCGRAKSRLTS